MQKLNKSFRKRQFETLSVSILEATGKSFQEVGTLFKRFRRPYPDLQVLRAFDENFEP
jgi:hypothetical protein